MAVPKSAETKTPFDRHRLEELSGVLKSLAHPSRLLIVEALGEQPYCVYALTAMIGADTSTVSKHLSVLKSAGVVRDEKKGNQVHYSLTCPCVLDAVKRLTPILEQRFRRFSDILEKSASRKD